jgi:isopenicillin N synthase-like dioxygenase
MRAMNSVPVIDVARLGEPKVLAAIDEACRDWGFFQVVAHGIEETVIEALHGAMRAFFAQPMSAKRCVLRSEENPWGFYDRELTKNTRDWKQVFDCGQEGDHEQPTPWPVEPVDLRATVHAFSTACEKLAFRLLGAMSSNLGMSAHHLDEAFCPAHTSFLRLNYYPECPDPAHPTGVETPSKGHLGVNHHTDAGALTLLLQDEQAGLEVFHDGVWHGVEPRSDALVVNIGDIVQVCSNDRYKAALHRVAASTGQERYSAPYFFNPAYQSTYAPLPTTINASSPTHYRPIQWGEFRGLRAAGDYSDCGDEVQIHHYRIDNEAREAAASQEEETHGLH